MNDSTLAVSGFTPFAQIPTWVLRNSDLSHGAVRLYAVIMTYADNQTRTAFPGRERLGADLGVSARQIGTYIKELETHGAIQVERRRNKRTGNYYANHYTLRFSAPEEENFPPPTEADFPLTRPTTSTTSTSVSPSTDVEEVSPARSASGTHNPSNDPISATFARSKQRRALVDAVVHLAHCKTEPDNPDAEEAAIDTLYYLLVETFGDDDGIGHLVYDRDWTPPRKAVSRLEAGTWLNKLLNTWQEDIGRLTWPAV